MIYQVIDQFPFGHGEKSVYLISRFMRLTDEEALAIRWHMGPYDEAARSGSRTYVDTLHDARQRYPLMIELHVADMAATKKEQEQEARNEH